MRRGLNSVRRICRQLQISGVHGPIIELLDCEEKFYTAVEVTAGNRLLHVYRVLVVSSSQLILDHLTFVYVARSLFHVVVDDDEISTVIIKHLNSSNGGRVTFIPLNRVKAPHVNYPQNSDAIPLLKKLKFSPNHYAAFSQVSVI